MTLEDHVLSVIKSSSSDDPWKTLITLFAADREAFYRLANEGVASRATNLQALADLAGQVKCAVRESYVVDSTPHRARVIMQSGQLIPIPDDLVANVRDFLRTLDGKTSEERCGRDYEGEEISQAEVLFKLGERTKWNACRAAFEESTQETPLVLRVASEDLDGLKIQPPYVTYALRHCATQTVLAPTAAYKGLKRGPGGMTTVNSGYAFCGKPRHAFDNAGKWIAPPNKMIFVVFADSDQYVFDWDWVNEDPHHEGFPRDSEIRFDDLWVPAGPAELELPLELKPGSLDAKEATYSERGDCIFCYMKDDVSWAERINSDLTVFREFRTDEVTGFKVKNVRKILKQDTTVLNDAPDLTVSVDAILLSTLKYHKDAHVQVYKLIIQALHKSTDQPPKVRVPSNDSEAVAVEFG